MDSDVRHPLGADYVRHTIQELCTLLDSSDAENARKYLQELMSSLGLERRLSTLGITRDSFSLIAQNVNLERLENHPRMVTNETIQSILEQIA
jgi:alcohol dehydrogenase class IV